MKSIRGLLIPLLVALLAIVVACVDEEGGVLISGFGSNSAAASVSFADIDRDMTENEIAGDLLIVKASDESSFTEYRLYWGSSDSAKLSGQDMIASFLVNGSNHTHTFGADTAIPNGATHLLVYAVNGETELGSPTAYDIPDGVVEMVENISLAGSSNPERFIGMNNVVYFWADDGTNIQLWRSDGLTASMVKNTGAPNTLGDMAVIGGTLFFKGNDSSINYELWKSDGTNSGTNKILDIRLGTDGSSPAVLTPVGNLLFFKANDGSSGEQLWKSDGTPGGTNMVKNIYSDPGVENLTVVGNTLFFTAKDDFSNQELWKSDGSDPGTVKVKDIEPGSTGSYPSGLTEFNGELFFQANKSADGGAELWKSDGSDPGTVRVQDINLSGNSYPKNFKEFNGSLFFSAQSDSSNREVWKTNGTSTTLVKSISIGGTSPYDPQQFTVVGNKLFFTAEDASPNIELWVTDGTTTSQVKNILDSGSSDPQNLTAVGDYLFFAANDGAGANDHGMELWFSDGTEAGTFLLKDIYEGPDSGVISSEFLYVGGNLFFGAQSTVSNKELWRYYTK